MRIDVSDTKCARIGCERPSHRFWRLCDEHGPEYGDIVQRLVRASTPHLTTDTTARGYDLKRAIEVAPQAWRDAWAGQTRVPPTPPTLREWLGDRVGELGPWADVLREQPVPAGWVREWQWSEMFVSWIAHGDTIHGPRSFTVEPSDVISACRGDAVQPHDAYLMALFTRHPDVKPEPKPAKFPWDPYPAVL